MVSHDLARLGGTIIYRVSDRLSINNIIYFRTSVQAKYNINADISGYVLS